LQHGAGIGRDRGGLYGQRGQQEQGHT